MWYTFSENAPSLSPMVFSGPNKCTDLFSSVSNWHFSCLGPPRAQKGPNKGPNWKFSQVWPYVTTNLMERVWTRLEQHWGHLGWTFWSICQTQNAPNMAPNGLKWVPNRLKIAIWPHKLAGRPILIWTGWNKVETQQGHSVKAFWVSFSFGNGGKFGYLTSKLDK